MREFVEKPSPEEIDTNLVNAGAYILEREVLDEMAPAGTRISIERDVFPRLVGRGLFGYEADGYWLDIGTPAALPAGDLRHPRGRRAHRGRPAPGRPAGACARTARRSTASCTRPRWSGRAAAGRAGAIVGGRTVLGRDVSVGPGAHIESSVLLDGCRSGRARGSARRSSARGVIDRRALPRRGRRRARRGRTVGADNVLAAGTRIFPGVQAAAGAIAF